MEIVVAFVLLLYAQGEVIEHTGPYSISECLSVKREIRRNGWKDRGDQTRYACEERAVRLGKNWEGKQVVVGLAD